MKPTERSLRLVVYELNSFGEVNYTRWFCCRQCRDEFVRDVSDTPLKMTRDTLVTGGEVCDTCGEFVGSDYEVMAFEEGRQ